MAAKRIAKSAVDWVAFAERVPPNQLEAFRHFKSKSDQFLSRVYRHPENLPKIDFAFYKSRIAAAGMVDTFEKGYQGVTVAYPKDKNNMKATIDTQQKDTAVAVENRVKEIKKSMTEAQALIDKLDSVPPLNEMTIGMYGDYFPDKARNPVERPSFWPHKRSEQPENDPNTIN